MPRYSYKDLMLFFEQNNVPTIPTFILFMHT